MEKKKNFLHKPNKVKEKSERPSMKDETISDT